MKINNYFWNEVLAKRQQKLKISEFNSCRNKMNSFNMRRMSQVLSVWM